MYAQLYINPDPRILNIIRLNVYLLYVYAHLSSTYMGTPLEIICISIVYIIILSEENNRYSYCSFWTIYIFSVHLLLRAVKASEKLGGGEVVLFHAVGK